ncbi:MAG: hypothetical protein JKY92_01370 [Magnetovibrio sp.]|nr:hypothetical protein [Magnetovibrio sp.]
MKLLIPVLVAVLGFAVSANAAGGAASMPMENVDGGTPKRIEGYPPKPNNTATQYTLWAPVETRGNTVSVDEDRLVELCGDGDGCSIRLGMYNWDGTGRTASRASLLYYNPVNHAWRADVGDPSGTDFNGVVQHVMTAFNCYFTDAEYKNWIASDAKMGFGLLSWKQYKASCVLTITD